MFGVHTNNVQERHQYQTPNSVRSEAMNMHPSGYKLMNFKSLSNFF